MKAVISTLIVMFFANGWVLAQEKRKTDSLVLTKFTSSLLGEERKLVVHLPFHYEKEPHKKYPVMYVLDGSRLDFDLSDRLFALSSAGLCQEAIVVGILNNNGTRERDLTPPFMQTETDDAASPFGKGDQFLAFLQQELIPRIDSSYRTSGYQTISGHSRAGLFVLYSLLENPGLFQARFCYSTPAWRFNNLLIRRLEDRLRNHTLEKPGYLFYSVGEQENQNIIAAFGAMTDMLKKWAPPQLVWDSHLTPLADHQTNPVLSVSRGLRNWAENVKK